MSVDLNDYVDQVKLKVNPPGQNLFPNADDDEWGLRLAGGFWQARIEGITALDVFTCDEDGVVTPQSGDTDIDRLMIQLVICWTAWAAITNLMTSIKSVFIGKAGPVTVETQQSATVLKARMDELRSEKALVLTRLSDVGTVTVQVVDMIGARDEATYLGLTDWVSGDGF